MTKLRRTISIFAAAALSTIAALAPQIGAAQQYNTLPPNSIIANVTGRSNPGNALAISDFITVLNLFGLTKVGDVDFTMGSTHRVVSTDRAHPFTAPHTWTLPRAVDFPAGQPLYITDLASTVSPTNTLTIPRAANDTINGGIAPVTLNSPNGAYVLIPDGYNNWLALPISGTPTGAAGGGLTGTYPNPTLANPSASTLGGVKSLAPIANQFLTSIGTDGTPTQAQPAIGDISGVVGNVPATQTSSNACSTCIGARLSNSASTSSLVSGTPQNIGTQNVPAGDWDLFCGFTATGSGAPTVTEVWVSINNVSATSVYQPGQSYRMRGFSLSDPLLAGTIGPFQVSQSSANNYYCVGQASFTGGTGFVISGKLVMRRPQ